MTATDAIRPEHSSPEVFADSRDAMFDVNKLLGSGTARRVLLLLIVTAIVSVPYISEAAQAIGITASISQLIPSLLIGALAFTACRWLHVEADRLSFAHRFQQACTMQGALRRYVSDAVATEL